MKIRIDVNKFVEYVLGIGVALSFLVLVWGSILYLIHPTPGGAPGSILHIFRGVAELDPRATINLGLLILLITPIARVIAAMAAFAIERDRRYALISLIVLTVLIVSALVGR